MKDKKYFLSITELLDGVAGEKLMEAAIAKLDKERGQKAQKATHIRKRAESIGAGLLLQWGLQEMAGEGVTDAGDIVHLTVSQVLEHLQDPIEPTYTYGPKGKPYFKDCPLFFSISHSGDYVFCVFSEQEVGADIQYRKPGAGERIMKRMFTKAEREAIQHCESPEEWEVLFYRYWTRKEAYGKLTGEGIVPAVSADVTGESPQKVCWEDDVMPEGYQLSICKWTEEKE